jgi:hypothetical protein
MTDGVHSTGELNVGDPWLQQGAGSYPAGVTYDPSHPVSRGISHSIGREKEDMAKSGRRIVQVFVIDPDEALPLEHAVLHMGGQQVTDATDEELYYQINIPALLEQHNQTRQELDLPAIRIRDLKKRVETILEF